MFATHWKKIKLKIESLAHCFRVDRSGATAVEFALVAPWFFFSLFMMFDLSLEYFAQAQLDYAMQDAARIIRINAMNGVSQSTVNQQICTDMSWLVSNCNLIQTYASTSSSYSTLVPTTLDANGNLRSTSFSIGTSQTPVLFQVAFLRPIYLMPLSGQSLVPTITSTLVFRNE